MAAGGVRGTAERDEAELPLLEHLKAMGWQHIPGRELQSAEGRSYRDVFLTRRMAAALRRINKLPGAASGWMSEDDALRAAERMKNAARNVSGASLPRANRDATDQLLHGVLEKGPDTRDAKVHFVDWSAEALGENRAEVLARNDFLVVDQLRVCNADGRDQVLDLVLFVNGIPVVVIECKSPYVNDGIAKAIQDLRAYSGRPLDGGPRGSGTVPGGGIPELFTPVQLLVAADGRDAVLGTISSAEEHYALWRSLEPDYDSSEELRRELRAWRLIGPNEPVTLQHRLTAMVLKPRNLLNILRHYVFEMQLKSKGGNGRGGGSAARTGDDEAAKTVKVVCRHQQYRAVEKIIRKLGTGRTRLQTGTDQDERGGVIWHTQGAGKSFTMMFLARRLHLSPDPELNKITVVAVTDRRDLQRQLRKAVERGGSTVREAASQTDLQGMLERAGQDGGRAVIFATIQKFLGELPGLAKDSDGADTADGEDRALAEDFEQAQARVADGEDPEQIADPAPDDKTLKAAARIFPECSTSPRVLVLVDEAHRSHTSVLHACLRKALPNAARVGFTGTPLMQGRLTDTGRIFGLEPCRETGGVPRFLDEYTMDEAEADKVIVPVRYEGRTTTAEVWQKPGLNQRFEDLVEPLDEEQRQKVRERYATPSGRDVAESFPLIRAKAADMLAHYVTGPLTGGFKAQVAVVSRRAAVYYRNAFRDARAELLQELKEFDESGEHEALRLRKPETYDPREIKLFWAWRHREVLRRMDFVPVISAGSEQKSGVWREWTDETKQRDHIDRFLREIPEYEPDKPWTDNDLPVAGGRTGAPNPWSGLAPHRSAEEVQAPVTFLIVKSMLLTGFDAPIEQVLYLDRPIRDAELLQAIARVNRPAVGKTEGLVVDYYGVLDNLGTTLAAYRNKSEVRASLRSMDEEIPGMRAAAEKVALFLSRTGIDGTDLGTRDGLTRAMLALDDSAQRAEFDRLLGEFLGAVDRVLPHEGALECIPDVRRWSLLQMRVRRHYRDGPGGGFSIRGYGRKVRELIAEHLRVQGIEQAIPPVSILAPDFDETVGRLPVREAAAEQAQALRYHLEERRAREDRAVYRQIAEELERVLEEFAGRWEEIKAHLGPLVERARRAEETDPRVAGLSHAERLLYVRLGEKLEEDPDFETPEPEFLHRLVMEVRDVAVGYVGRASFEAEEAHVQELESHIWGRLRGAGLRPRSGGLAALERLAGVLAGHVMLHLRDFQAEARRQ
ncbi:type I restriction endonuclease subunit R [Streptomyces gamaensis]|uniref:type I site-specific deoxyribonuclease n=1 Tax=Streptomyces gamaensis TaxID=1763542 RepID=A0ABW0YVU8_9ACTN